jgi:hypothetical protein
MKKNDDRMTHLFSERHQCTYRILRECYASVISGLNDTISLRFPVEFAILAPGTNIHDKTRTPVAHT